MADTKKCSGCHVEKSVLFFGKSKNRKDGLCEYCKECVAKHAKARREKNKAREVIVVPESKTCPGCRTEKLSLGFGKSNSSGDGLCDYCKECRIERSRVYFEKNRSRGNIAIPDFKTCPYCKIEKTGLAFSKNKNTKDGLAGYCKECRPIIQRKLLYGATDEWFAATLEAQDGACAICRSKFTEDNPPCVDHDHLTDVLRGLLCHRCNTGVGLLQDSPQQLRVAALYIEKYKEEVKG